MPNNLLRWFAFDHLPDDLAAISAPFATLALDLDVLLDECAEKTAGLRKLLEAKDCAVRAAIQSRSAD